MIITNERYTIVMGIMRSLIGGCIIILAIFGLMEVTFNQRRSRTLRNHGACEEVCVTMDLRREERNDSCWCGDEDHTIRVAPLAWENSDGKQSGRVITDNIEFQLEH